MTAQKITAQKMTARKVTTQKPVLIDPWKRCQSDPRLRQVDKLSGERKVCIKPSAFLWPGKELSGAPLSEILYGEDVLVLSSHDQAFEIIALNDHYYGWVHAGSFAPATNESTHLVSNLSTNLYAQPTLKSAPIKTISMGSMLHVKGEQNGAFILTDEGWVTHSHITQLDSLSDSVLAGSTLADSILDFAEKWVGVPYVWGGRSIFGIDCSGLVQVCLAAIGMSVHRDSDLQWESIGRALDDDESPQKGDLAFFPGHVGIMVDGTHILHANATNMAVTTDPLAEVIRWIENENRDKKDFNPFHGFKRL